MTATSQDAIGDQGSGRRWSLRREWSRAFSIMLLLLLATAAATIIGVRGVVDQVEGTAVQLHLESNTVEALSTAIVDHEQVAHKLLSDEPVDRSAFIQQQQHLSRLFDLAAVIFPTSNDMRATILK